MVVLKFCSHAKHPCLSKLDYKKECIPVGCVPLARHHARGDIPDRDPPGHRPPLDRDPPGQRPSPPPPHLWTGQTPVKT